jgi:tRNA pseudouridine38-40 synthase
MRRTYRATIAYDGSRFCGYALQRGQRTVESVLVEALRPLVPELPRLPCGGRTDRGVHATGQVVSFYAREALCLEAVAAAIDGAMPDALALRALSEVPRRFHAGFSAKSRRYVYFCDDGGAEDAARLDAMVRELVGLRCFSAFARSTPPGANTVKRLLSAAVRREGPDRLRFDFEASGFLRRQVRVMVATALCEAASRAPPDALLRLAERGDRRATAAPAEPGGLYLAAVVYPPLGH